MRVVTTEHSGNVWLENSRTPGSFDEDSGFDPFVQ